MCEWFAQRRRSSDRRRWTFPGVPKARYRRVALVVTAFLIGGCETVDGPGFREGPLEVVWQAPSGTILAPPLLVDDLVVVRQLSGRVEARRRSTGVVLWERDLAISRASDAPVRVGDVVLVNGPTLVALDVHTGSVRWQRASAQFLTTAAAASDGDVAFFPDLSTLFALEGDTGRERWRADLDGVVSHPLVAGELVLVNVRTLDILGAPLTGGEIVALERATGAVRWRAGMPAPPSLEPTSAFGDVATDRAVFLTRDGQLRALRLSDGQLLWSRRVVSFGAPRPLVDGDQVLVPEEAGSLSARDLASGALRWTRGIRPALGGELGTSAAALSVVRCGGRVCVVDGNVVELARDGTLLQETPARFTAPPAIDEHGVAYGGAVRVETLGSRILAVRLTGDNRAR